MSADLGVGGGKNDPDKTLANPLDLFTGVSESLLGPSGPEVPKMPETISQ